METALTTGESHQKKALLLEDLWILCADHFVRQAETGFAFKMKHKKNVYKQPTITTTLP